MLRADGRMLAITHIHGRETTSPPFGAHFNRRLRQVEFPDGFAAVIMHFVFGHFDALKGNAWREAGQVGDPVIGIGQRQNGDARQLDGGGFHAGETAQDLKTSFSNRFLFPRIYRSPTSPLLHGQEVALGDIVHVDQVHAGFNIGGHPALHEVEDDLAGGRGFYVRFADRRAGIYDHDRESCPREFQHFLLGEVFRPFVVTCHLIQRDRRLLRPQPAARGSPIAPIVLQ